MAHNDVWRRPSSRGIGVAQGAEEGMDTNLFQERDTRGQSRQHIPEGHNGFSCGKNDNKNRFIVPMARG